jgi:hypothetical protein
MAIASRKPDFGGLSDCPPERSERRRTRYPNNRNCEVDARRAQPILLSSSRSREKAVQSDNIRKRGRRQDNSTIGNVSMRIVAIIFAAVLWFGEGRAQERAITVASTTSTEESGFFGYLLPQFTKAAGIVVKVVAVGTGQALDIGRRGDADVVFVHGRPAEDKFMSEGQGVKRFDVMYNDFVIVGPTASWGQFWPRSA